MASFSKRVVSQSTNGKFIKVTATSTPGTAIHTAVAGTSDFDEIYLYAINTSLSDVTLTIEWGGTTDPDDLLIVTIPAQQGLTLVVPGLLLQNELVVRAYAGTANVINIGCFVNRITS